MKQRIEVYYQPVGASEFATPGWYWIDYRNVKRNLVYEAGPFSTEAEAQQSLQEYLNK